MINQLKPLRSSSDWLVEDTEFDINKLNAYETGLARKKVDKLTVALYLINS